LRFGSGSGGWRLEVEVGGERFGSGSGRWRLEVGSYRKYHFLISFL